jgi:hypothetical protein
MQKIVYFFLFLSLFLWGCKSRSHITKTPQNNNSNDTAEYANIEAPLLFPSDVLYVIGREYELINDTTSTKYQSALAKGITSPENPISLPEYMEMRLIELYPQKAFKGMMAHFNAQNLCGLIEKSSQIPVLDDNYKELSFLKTSKANQTDSFHPFVSTEDEISYMNLTPKEQEKYLALNQLAASEKFAGSDDFKDIANDDSILANLEPQDISFFLEENIFLSMLVLSPGAYFGFRVKLCKERAVSVAKEYYDDQISCGKKGDAFKHLYISMMLRRYLSEDLAYMTMDLFWENQGNNSPCDKYMDLHNNYVGRHTQYNQFRGSFLKDMYDWKSWSRNIHHFVENESNAIQKKWSKSQVEPFIAKDKETSNKDKYIYWNRGMECEDAPKP